MAKNLSNGPHGRAPGGQKREWFARRQVYLRAGQDSQYVELSPLLQIGVALGFGVLALWLVGASYGAVAGFLGKSEQSELLTRLNSTEQALGDVTEERDAALADVARIADLEEALAEAKAVAAEADSSANESEETLAVKAELDQTQKQLEELHVRLSESKADQAALQARFEAEVLATTDASEKTAEEAASLHAQLEDAFAEMEELEKAREEAAAKLAAANEETRARDETAERNTALLKAATAEIERLQETVAQGQTKSSAQAETYETTIANLEEQLGDTVAARSELSSELDDLRQSFEESKAAEATAAVTAKDAELQALTIEAELKEADLLATIDRLRTEVAQKADLTAADGTTNGTGDAAADDQGVSDLRERVRLAESEIERMLLAGLRADDESVASVDAAATISPSDQAERLRAELLEARADIIKLNADVKAAKQRLADQAEVDDGQTAKPDNSAKLEQQLASTRSRVQQLNKALADAKLREVAIDLALISVVPSPSPPAPR